MADLSSFVSGTFRNAASSGGISPEVQRAARELAERLAVGMQASIMVRFGDPKVIFIVVCMFGYSYSYFYLFTKAAEVFLASRIKNGSCRQSLGSYCIDASTAQHLVDSNTPRK